MTGEVKGTSSEIKKFDMRRYSQGNLCTIGNFISNSRPFVLPHNFFALCELFDLFTRHRHTLLQVRPKKNLFYSVSNLHRLPPRMRNFLLNDIDLSRELGGGGGGGAASREAQEDDAEFRLIYYADYDQQTFKFWGPEDIKEE